MKRTFFTARGIVRERAILKTYLKDADKSCMTVLEITPQLLLKKGIEVLVLDFDGVLSSHASHHPLPEVVQWLHQLKNNWPHAVFIFSNKPHALREAFFKEHLTHIGFVKNVLLKPYPDGLLHIQKMTGVAAQKILMVDDRLLTGILSGIIAGTQALLIKKPFQDFKARPASELGFYLLRLLDRVLCGS